jgi:hypothetical protein
MRRQVTDIALTGRHDASRRKQATGLKKMYLLYIFPPELHTLMTRCSNFFNPAKKNSFGFAANRKIGKAKDLSAPLRITHSVSRVSGLCPLSSGSNVSETGPVWSNGPIWVGVSLRFCLADRIVTNFRKNVLFC